MAGTSEGGYKASLKNKQNHGDDFYTRIGMLGQKAYNEQPKETRKPRGFAAMKANGELDKIRAAGAKGGAISRRGSNE